MKPLRYPDDSTAQELFTLAGRALADPGDVERRREFWRFVDDHAAHPWVQVLKRAAASSHPHGLGAGNKKINEAIDDGYPTRRPTPASPPGSRALTEPSTGEPRTPTSRPPVASLTALHGPKKDC